MKSTIVKLILICYALPLFAGKFEQAILREQIVDSITLYYKDKYAKKKKCQKVEKVLASLVLYEKVMEIPSPGGMVTNRIPTGTFKTEVEIDNRFVDPYETDSIIVNGKVGIPHSKSQWAFPYESGLISVAAMLPNSAEYNPYYISNRGKTHLFPPYLSVKDTNAVIAEISKKLAKFPRLYCDYMLLGWNGIGSENSPKNKFRVELISALNKIPEEQLLDSAAAEKAAKLSYELLVSPLGKKKDSSDIAELLTLEPNSVIGNCKMAELAIKTSNMPFAMEYYKKAFENQVGEDFLVAELRGKLYEAEGNKDEAKNLYNRAIEIIGDKDSPYYKAKIKDLQNWIGLMNRN